MSSNSENNNFLLASRKKLRFKAKVGLLEVEHLWELPLTSAKNDSLESIAQTVWAEIEQAKTKTVTFVTTKDTGLEDNEIRLEIVKTVISIRQAENEAASNAKARAEQKQKLLEALAKRKDASMENMTEAEIEAALAAL